MHQHIFTEWKKSKKLYTVDMQLLMKYLTSINVLCKFVYDFQKLE